MLFRSAAACPLNLEEGLHEEKDFSYVVRRENPKPQKMQEEDLARKKVRPLWEGQHEERRKYISVTELVAPEAVSGSEYAPKAQQLGSGLARAQQGTNAHRLFEALKFTTHDELMQIADEDLKKPLQFLATTKQLPMLEIIAKGHVEWGFALKYQNSLMQGQIDLWGIVEDTLWMVDYKTGSQKYSDTAFKQLEAYTWALLNMSYLKQVKNVKLAVVYPMDEIVKVQDLDLSKLDQKMKDLIAARV